MHRQGSQFRDGMLASIYVGSEDAVPERLWDAFGAHRELCALQQVRPRKVNADRYGRFLAALVRDPPWVEIRQGCLAAIAARRGRWAVPAVRYAGMWDLERPDNDLVQLAALDPELERLECTPSWIAREQVPVLIATIARLPEAFPRLAAIQIEINAWSLRDFDDDQRARLAALPLVELVS